MQYSYNLFDTHNKAFITVCIPVCSQIKTQRPCDRGRGQRQKKTTNEELRVKTKSV